MRPGKRCAYSTVCHNLSSPLRLEYWSDRVKERCISDRRCNAPDSSKLPWQALCHFVGTNRAEKHLNNQRNFADLKVSRFMRKGDWCSKKATRRSKIDAPGRRAR